MKNNSQKNIINDERLQGVSNKSLAAAGVVAVIYAVAMMIYKIVSGKNPLPEILLLVAMGLAVIIVNKANKVYDVPKTIIGKSVDTALTKAGRINRIKAYLLDSLFFPVAYLLIDIFIDKNTSVISGVSDFAICFAVFFVLDYIIGEHQVKAYNKYMDSL